MEDGYVRISTPELSMLRLHHVTSGIDLSIALPPGVANGVPADDVITGYTEWAGDWRRHSVSLGWDWGIVGDLIVTLNPDEIRTNIRLVDEHGQDAPAALSRVYVLEFVELLPWRDFITQVVHGQRE